MNLVIGLGGAGKYTLDRILQGLRVNEVKNLYVNTDSKSLESIPDKNRIALKEGDFSLSRNSFGHPIQSDLLELVAGSRQCFIVCGLGGNCANAMPALLEVLTQIGATLHLIVFSPFAFEGERVQKSEIQLQGVASSLINLAGFKNIALQNHPRSLRNESLTQFFEYIAIDVELYIYRNLRIACDE